MPSLHPLLLSVALLAFAVPARSDEAGFEADRPDFTNGPNVVPPGAVQLEVGWTRDHVPGFTLHSAGEGLLRVGLTPRLELRAGIPTWFHGAGSGSSTSGFGDVTIGGKLFLGESAHTRWGLVADADLPSGAEAFRSSAAGAEAALAAERPVGPLDVSANLVAANEADGDDRRWTGAASISAGFDLAARLGGYAEWYEQFANGDTAQQFADAGASYQVSPHLQVDVRTGAGFAGAEDERFVGAGGSWRW
jgi:outer membrane putative beta-barrel porin/alpha-amylase